MRRLSNCFNGGCIVQSARSLSLSSLSPSVTSRDRVTRGTLSLLFLHLEEDVLSDGEIDV